MLKIEHVLPEDIEKNSFATIERELIERGRHIPEEYKSVVYRVIHATADFEYADTMTFSEGVLKKAREAFRGGAHVVTDTTMAMSGINKRVLAKFGGEAHCFVADEDVAREAKERQVTRSSIAMEKAVKLDVPVVFAVGNAPTALIALKDAMDRGFRPCLVIGVPVGFVNVVAAKELITASDAPYIVNIGRKGGSNVAAAIVNAILYQMARD